MNTFTEDELMKRKREVKSQIDNFFDEDDNPNYGDLNYQRLLEEEEQIDELLNEDNDEDE